MGDQHGQQNRSRQQIENMCEGFWKTRPYSECVEENVRPAVESDPDDCGKCQACEKWDSRADNLAIGDTIVKAGNSSELVKCQLTRSKARCSLSPKFLSHSFPGHATSRRLFPCKRSR